MTDTEATVPPMLVPLYERCMAWLSERHPWPVEDELTELMDEAMEAVVPKGKRLWQMFIASPDLALLPGPGAVADTIEEVVRDTIKEALDWPLCHWAKAVEASKGDR